MTSTAVHPVNERPPTVRPVALGFQHVLVMYAGAIAVPLMVGRALKLSLEQVALLISAGLFCCGLVTSIQSQLMAHSLNPLLESGILLTAILAAALYFCVNGGRADEAGAIAAGKTAEAH